MRIVIGYPPLSDPRGFHQTGQNRQAQVFHEPAFIYPYVPAMAATLLSQAGHEVRWMDGPAMGLDWDSYLTKLMLWQPDLIAWEAKTPSINRTMKLTYDVNRVLPDTTIILMGDHVTALPEEARDHSAANIILTGGDYDFGLVDIVAAIEAGTLHPHDRLIWDKPTDTLLTTLPVVDRKLTHWDLYGGSSGSGNYKYLPGTHTMIGRDCWWRHDGGCTFCSWTNIYKNWRVGTVDHFIRS